MTAIEVRRATEADLPESYDVYYENEVAGDPNPPPRGEVSSCLRHVFATGELYVAERGGRIVGFAALITRGPIAYLTDLFVRRAEQSGGIGSALLRRILPADGRIRCTMSSRDPRALALYVRAGLRPQWPNFWLRASADRPGALPRGGVDVVEAGAGDAELVGWDAAASGRHRPAEHQYWRGEGAIPLWFERGGARVGYGYVQTRSPGALWSPDAITVGPIGALTPADARECVCAAIEFARARAEVVRLAVPGPHPSLAALLDAGFQIRYVETFVSTAATPFVDPERYVGSGDFF
jgi:GNAT superfamily N-acetyltransferase